jgi:hypothetical protein
MFVSNYRETLNNARGRIKENPEGVAASTAIGAISLPTTETLFGISATILAGEISGDLGKMALAGGIATAATLLNVREEIKALEEKKYCATLGGTLLYDLTGNSKTSAVTDNVVSIVGLGLPGYALAVINRDPGLFATSALAAAYVNAGWNGFFNTLIEKGQMDPVIKGIKIVEVPLKHGVKKIIKPIKHGSGKIKDLIKLTLKKATEIIDDLPNPNLTLIESPEPFKAIIRPGTLPDYSRMLTENVKHVIFPNTNALHK